MKKVNPVIGWWVTPKLPQEDIFASHNFISQWVIHPVKRRLARVYLKFLQKYTHIKVIGITGSAGKTTTKEMLASILKLEGKTVYTPKNIDSIYSIPNTILSTPPGTKYLILEMGVEYPGEMDFYLWLTKPDIGVITNIFPTHTQFLGDISGVFEEKIKLVLGLSKEGTAVLNSGDKMLKSLSDKLAVKIIWFNPDVNPMVQNANAAKMLAKSFGVKNEIIKKGLATYKKPAHRLSIINHESGAMILDDSYNSNPWAALSSLEYFNKIAKGKKIAVLGDMLELGDYDEDAHRELGRSVANSGFEIVIAVGKSSRFLIDEIHLHSNNTKTYLFSSVGGAIPIIKSKLRKDVSILVKGSHSIHLDKLIDSLH
ncbi:MAG TPA: UDP-N-acetylmuramoyl-tripeptide--D-alanyl-D-alanine ligase [Candidatus Saccharimonadales bacterium]|jgi:UDP-N-acetylmuramoyl-tripeptide--D-alanyl-D-alanine ligase|nr:UDP-N-acetylmuramoyl-tripeptide--D-alanyl-D-alanine ligase [Candidatus Saccharimonadales bacterium]